MSTSRDDLDPDEREVLARLHVQLDAIRERHRDDPPIDLLRAAGSEALPDDVQAAVSKHLAGSAWSRALLEGLGDGNDTLDRQREQRLLAGIKNLAAADTRATPQRSWLKSLLLTSAVAAAAFIIWVAVRDANDVALPAGEPAATVAVAQPSPEPLLLPFETPDVRLSMAALTWRGSTAGDNQLLADLKPGLDAYRQGDYAAAERELTALESRYPNAVELLFYRGIARLFLNDAQGALTSLAAADAVADPTFAADVAFYRAVAEQRAGNLSESQSRLDALCKAGGDTAPRACTALAQLDAARPRP